MLVLLTRGREGRGGMSWAWVERERNKGGRKRE